MSKPSYRFCDTVPMTLCSIVSAIRQLIQNKINYFCQTQVGISIVCISLVWTVECLWWYGMRESFPRAEEREVGIKSKLEWRRHGTLIDADETMYQYDCVLSNLARFSFFHLIYRHIVCVLVRAPTTSCMWKMKMNTRPLPSNGNWRFERFSCKSHVCVFIAEKHIKCLYWIELFAEYFKRSTKHGNRCDTKRRFAHESERFCPQDWLWIPVSCSNICSRSMNLKKKKKNNPKRFSFFKLFVTKVTDH